MKIEQGFYIKQHIEKLNIDEYLLVLEIDGIQIKSVSYGGTPTDSVILNYQDIIDNGYTINVLSKKDVVCLTKYETYLKNGIPSSYPVAMQYQWNGYKWADIPEGFYG